MSERGCAISLVLLLTAGVAAGAATDPPPSRPPQAELDELRSLYRARDYFSLRDRLEILADGRDLPVEARWLAAVLEQVFNHPEASNRTAEALLAEGVADPGLALRLQSLRLTNHLRAHRYEAALATAREILASPARDALPSAVAEARGMLPLLEALAAVPPQQVEIRSPSRLALGPTRRVPLTIDGQKISLGLDTGANLSVLMRSQARRLGLDIRPAGQVVSTSTSRQVLADLAVAERVQIGNVFYRNVVFLVFPDELLSFPDGRTIPGLLGFPVVEAMGEVVFRRDDVMEIPARPPSRRSRNLALHELDPLIRVRYGRDELICRLDTGAQHTVFYEPFYRRYRARLEAVGEPLSARAGGVGGFEEIPALRLPTVVLTVAAAGVTLRRVEVYTRAIRPDEDNFLFCNLGLDALRQYRSYAINFRDMALILR